MPIRFSTQAANADRMVDDVPPAPTPKAVPQARGTDPKEADSKDIAGKPGKDINAAGFIKDKDADKP